MLPLLLLPALSALSAATAKLYDKEPIVIAKPRRKDQIFSLPRNVSSGRPLPAWRCNDNGEWEDDACRCFEGWAGRNCSASQCGIHGTPKSLVCRNVPVCLAKFPGRHLSHHCLCSVGWEGPLCRLPRCYYGRRSGRGCACVGNYAPPHCQSCRRGFYGIDCSFELMTTNHDKPPRYTRRGSNSALALGLVSCFVVLMCVALGFLWRCAAVLASSVASLCPTAATASRDAQHHRRRPPPLPRWGSRSRDGSWLGFLAMPGSDPPSYHTSLVSSPPSYQDSVQSVLLPEKCPSGEKL